MVAIFINMIIREIKQSDFLAVYNLWQEAGLDVAEFTREKKELLMAMKLNQDACLLAEIKGEIIGAVIGAFNGKRAWIYHLAIHPAWQRKGYGAKLFKKVEEVLLKKGATKLMLTVSSKNLKVLNFYKKFGYSLSNGAVMVGKDLR